MLPTLVYVACCMSTTIVGAQQGVRPASQVATVRVDKPQAPIVGKFDTVGAGQHAFLKLELNLRLQDNAALLCHVDVRLGGSRCLI